MKKKINHVVVPDLHEALSILGYVQLGSPAAWRHQQFHLFLRDKGKERLVLKIHEDLPSRLPPFHYARHRSRRLREEMRRILEAYRNRRAARVN